MNEPYVGTKSKKLPFLFLFSLISLVQVALYYYALKTLITQLAEMSSGVTAGKFSY